MLIIWSGFLDSDVSSRVVALDKCISINPDNACGVWRHLPVKTVSKVLKKDGGSGFF